MMATHSPRAISSEMPLRTGVMIEPDLKVLVRLRVCSIGVVDIYQLRPKMESSVFLRTIMRAGIYPATMVANARSATRTIVPVKGATMMALLMGSTMGCAEKYGTRNP